MGVPVFDRDIPQAFWEGTLLLVSPQGGSEGTIAVREGRVLVVYFVTETGL